MATYLYRCPDCTQTREFYHGMNESPTYYCEWCYTRMPNIPHPPMVRVINAEYSGMTRKTCDGKLSDWEDTKFR